MLYVAFRRGSQTWSSQAHQSRADLTMIGCLCNTDLQLLLITPPQSRTAALASARITGKWAMGKKVQPSAENFGDNTSSVWQSGAMAWEGPVMVRSVAGRTVTGKCLDVFPVPSAGNVTFYTFYFHFKYSCVPSKRVCSDAGIKSSTGGSCWQCTQAASPLPLLQPPSNHVHHPQAGQ